MRETVLQAERTQGSGQFINLVPSFIKHLLSSYHYALSYIADDTNMNETQTVASSSPQSSREDR